MKNKIHILLTGDGYTVKSFGQFEDALADLETSSAYALIISSYRMPKIKGDAILKKAKQVSPDALRMLIADASEMETLVNAINFAEIHACLKLPFQDEELLNHVNHCCRQYEVNQKQKNLLRLTQRQNKQLFQVAAGFKKKETQYPGQIESKNKEIRILESKIHYSERSAYAIKPILLKDVLDKWNIAFSPDSFHKHFMRMKYEIKKILETATASSFFSLETFSYKEAVNRVVMTNNHKDLVDILLPLTYSYLEKKISPKEETPEDIFELALSDNRVKAFIRLQARNSHVLNPSQVKQFLEKNQVINGIAEDHEIESWLFKARPEDKPFLIARGRDPIHPKDAVVRYDFPTDFLHAGKIKKDGSIDFNDRGEIPNIEEGVLMAEKIPSEPGIPGIDVYGNTLMVGDPVDLAFQSGPGTQLSEDGLKIYSVVAGQPHLDALGNVSVCPEYKIKGDLGFETGNIDFHGNVIVTGTVKPGFKVKCASLTAKEINGAEIDISGDLNVSFGIVDTQLVKVKGSVQAKFVHNSTISAFGDLVVQKEIIDSKIHLSGSCVNENGLIINSEISAKMGIRAGTVGKPFSKPSTLRVGVDEHTNQMVAEIDAKLDILTRTLNGISAGISQLEQEDRNLHAVISKHAYVQDRSELEIKDIKENLKKLKASEDKNFLQKASNKIKELQANAKNAENEIIKGFRRQDEIAIEVAQRSIRMKELEESKNGLLLEKKNLLEFSNRQPSLPEITVVRKIESGTRIFSDKASLIIQHPSSRCRIKEAPVFSENHGGILFHQIQIFDLI